MPLTRNPTLPLPKELVGLTANERTELNDRIRTGKPAASVLLHARLVLKADAGADGPGGDDGPLAEAVACGPSPVSRLHPAVVEAGWPAALRRKQPTGRQYRQLDRVQAAPLIALACGAPPDGRTHWTLGCSPIGWSNWPWGTQSARKGCACPENNELHPWGRKPGLMPPPATAELVCALEAVLAGDTRPYDPARPGVCLDELSQPGVAETRTPLPAEPGPPERLDDAYDRCGTAHRFLPSDPRAGHRHVTATEPRPAGDVAKEGRDLLQSAIRRLSG